MSGDQRRHIYFRFNPFRTLTPSSLLITAILGVASGVYIFNDITRNAAHKAIDEQTLNLRNESREKEGNERKR